MWCTWTPMSGVTDTGRARLVSTSPGRNDDIAKTKVPMIEAAQVLSLPQGQAFALLEGNRRYNIRIPLADSRNDPFCSPSR